jgi:4-amino-4-deoxy-L-arabinose transferase-like glycosyltransferase
MANLAHLRKDYNPSDYHEKIHVNPYARSFKTLYVLILVSGLLLRVAFNLSLRTDNVYEGSGSDSAWYLANGYTLVTGNERGTIPVDVSKLPTAPLYLIFTGILQSIFPPESAILSIRLIQVVMGISICYFASSLARTFSNSPVAGLASLALLAFSPSFIIETGQVLTETLYMFLMFGGIWAYTIYNLESNRITEIFPRSMLDPSSLYFIGSAILLGLATLTRAVSLLFPVFLILHLLWKNRTGHGLKRALTFIIIYALIISSWSIYNLIRWERNVIGADGFSAFLYIGATTWQDPAEVDANLADQANLIELPTDSNAQNDIYRKVAISIILDDPLEWFAHRTNQLMSAILQPHGTTYYQGESLKKITEQWLQTNRSIEAFVRITTDNTFWPKLTIYIFHYSALALGILGVWINRRNWNRMFPLMAFVLYTFSIHFILEALPRYIFPTMVVWSVFAGLTIGKFWEYRKTTILSKDESHS